MKRLLKSRDYLTKCLVFVLLFGIISLGAIGGCNDNNGSGGGPDAILLGDHQEQIRQELEFALGLGEYDGNLNNIIFHCPDIDKLTQEERDIIKDAFDKEFVIIAYDSNEPCVVRLFAEVLMHPLIHAEIDSFDIPDGNEHDLFIVERHGRHVWTGQAVFETMDPASLTTVDNPDLDLVGEFDDDVVEVPTIDAPQFGTFEPHSVHTLEWITNYKARRKILEEIGTLTDIDLSPVTSLTDSSQNIDVSNRVSTQTGNIAQQSPDYINTVTYTARPPLGVNDYDDSSIAGTYQMTTYIWALTADTAAGVFSYIFGVQDYNLQSTNLFVRDKNRDRGWHLFSFNNSNNLEFGGSLDLTTSEAILLENAPQSLGPSIETQTSSTSTSLSGGYSSGTGLATGTASWSNSSTVQKRDVAIENLSLSQTGNDGTWRYTPKKVSPQDSDFCTWNSLSSPAQLGKTNFQPSQSFVYQIDPKFAGKTVKLESTWRVSVVRNHLKSCKSSAFGCKDCSKHHIDSTDSIDPDTPVSKTFHMSIALPPVPPPSN